jgi:uroporphyrin-3 C-methyltransferase
VATDRAHDTGPATAPSRPRRNPWPFLLFLLAIAIALLAGAAVWLRGWQPLQAQLATQAQTQAELARRLDALDSWQSTASDDLAALEGRSRALTARLEQLGPARLTAWSLAEADYLIRSAQRAAQFDYDPARAALALELASSSLAAVPGSSGLRAAIDSASAALAKVRVPDLDTLSGQLAQAASALKTAPLREPGTVAVESTPPGWRGAAQQAWRQLSEVIVVQRVDVPVQPLLRPQEQQYLRQQLALKLAAADYALRRRDTGALQGDLTELRAWADAYLDSSAPATAQALATLNDLAGTDLRPPLPDFSGLSEQLAAVRRAASADRMP